MSARLDELAARRRALQQRSGQLRDSLADQAAEAVGRVAWLDRAVGVLRRTSSRPVVMAATLALLVLRPLRAVRWGVKAAAYASLARRGWAAWRAFQR